ncbi:hypothetical protein ACHAQJ_007592 [Trichoderma viride]
MLSLLPTLIAVASVLLVTAEDCIPGPLSLPIANITLSTGKVQRGVAIKVGNPQQQFAFLPKWDNNNTFLYGPDCHDYAGLVKTNEACITLRGGVYENGSNSKGTLPPSVKLPPDLWSPKTFDVFAETVQLDTNDSLHNFPLAAPEDYKGWNLQGYSTQNIIGMAAGSTMVSEYRKAGSIASNSCGYYWGLDGVLDSDQTEGSFALGGYDQAKTIGDGVTQQFSKRSDCTTGMTVSIEDILLHLDGEDVSIFPGDSGGALILACIIPDLPVLMNMPLNPYFETILQFIDNAEWDRSRGVDFWNVVLDPTMPMYTGDLTFVLSSGLQIKISNHQLVVPGRYIDNNGDLAVNSSETVIRINSLQDVNQNSLPALGRYFFTSAYLLVNQDAGEFTLWQANNTLDSNLVAVDEKNQVLTTTQSCGMTTSTPTPTPTASLEPGPGGDKGAGEKTGNHSSLSSGSIAGIVIGVVLAVGVSLGALWWYFVRRRRRDAVEVLVVSETGKPAELESRVYQIPQELSSEPLRLDLVELPS